MKFITIDASKSMNPNTGESWYRAEAKVSVDEGEVPEDVFQALKKRLDSWLPNPFETIVKRPDVAPVSMEDAINSCTDMTVLVTYKLLVKGKPELQAVYDKKVIELSK